MTSTGPELDDELLDEPEPQCVGSCDDCECNIYDEDWYSVSGLRLCDQCAWSRQQCEARQP